MNLIIHDLVQDEWNALELPVSSDTKIVDNQGKIHKCVGCFGCWVKTPGQCVIQDEYQKMGEMFAQTDELILISKCSFGSFSSFVKNVMDRSISYILPFFEIRSDEMHHKARYNNALKLRAIFYGNDITEEEKATARDLVEANALNLNASVKEIVFVENKEGIREVF